MFTNSEIKINRDPINIQAQIDLRLPIAYIEQETAVLISLKRRNKDSKFPSMKIITREIKIRDLCLEDYRKLRAKIKDLE